MFKKIFIDLCNAQNESPSAVCMKLGLSNAAFSKWTDESVPRRATLQRMADYFGVSVDHLLGKEKSPAVPVIKHAEDELWQKISRLDEIDRTKIEAYADGLLAAEKYQQPIHQLKIAARGGGVKEITVTDSQFQELLNLPKVTSLDSDKS